MNRINESLDSSIAQLLNVHLFWTKCGMNERGRKNRFRREIGTYLMSRICRNTRNLHIFFVIRACFAEIYRNTYPNSERGNET